MGLDVSHDCWHGAYSAFMRWRCEIAKCLGIPLQMMEGFYGWEIEPEDIDKLQTLIRNLDGSYCKWASDLCRAATPGTVPLKWEAFKPSPLHELLNHSDCDGKIPWQNCTAIADALAQVMPKLPNVEHLGHIGNWRDKTQAFIDGLRLAASNQEDVEFR